MLWMFKSQEITHMIPKLGKMNSLSHSTVGNKRLRLLCVFFSGKIMTVEESWVLGERFVQRRLPDVIYHLQKCQSMSIKLILFIIRNGIGPRYILKGKKKICKSIFEKNVTMHRKCERKMNLSVAEDFSSNSLLPNSAISS